MHGYLTRIKIAEGLGGSVSDAATKTIQAVVDEDQLSLAIGRNGQNVRLASELTEWKIELYSSREWMERGSEQQIFAPLPGETDENVNPRLTEIEGLEASTVAVLEEAGYRTLDDIIDLEREDFLRLAGIAPEEADRLMTIIDELTTEDGAADEAADGAQEAAPSESDESGIPAAAVDGIEQSGPSTVAGDEGSGGDATNSGDGTPNAVTDAPAASRSKRGEPKGE